MPHPLSGLRVLDCSRLLPGPFASLVLADLGADVIKVEDTQGGDYTRWSPPHLGDLSAAFLLLNRNKRSIQINFKHPEGVEVFKRLVRGADMVLESYRPGVMDRLGVGYRALRACNPRLIYCAITGYGQDGPYRDRAGHDINYNAIAGVLEASGRMSDPPQLSGVQIADIGGGALYAVVGLLAALRRRDQTGEGDFVDISMTDGALSFNLINHAWWIGTGSLPRRGMQALNGGFLCYGVYETKDGRHMACGALEPKFWEAFCRAVGEEELIPNGFEPPTNAQARARIEAVFRSRTRDEWIDFIAQHRLDACIEPVKNTAEAGEDPQLKARGMFVNIPHPDPTLPPTVQLRTPVRLASQPEIPRDPPPPLGAQTAQVLGESGWSPAEIEALQAAGAIRLGGAPVRREEFGL